MIDSRARLRLALVVACVGAGRLSAQDTSLKVLEVEGHFGYTGVEVEKWANSTSVNYRDARALGINARLFFLRVGRARTRMGIELASRRLFRYEIWGQVGPTITREKHVVASQHIGVVARFRETARFNIDAGVGIDFLSDYSLPGVHTQATYLLINRGRFRVPIGGRIDIVLNETATAGTMSIVSGAAIRF